MPEKTKFSDFVAEHYDFRARDLSQLDAPSLLKKYAKFTAIALKGKNVYVRDIDEKTEYELGRIFVHEGFHIDRQRRIGWALYLVRYLFQKSFRRYEEVNGYTRTMEYKHMKGRDLAGVAEKYAQLIRDRYRIGSRQYKVALRDLRRNRDRILANDYNIVRDLWKQYKLKKI